jgi:phosphatidylserine/phosphatidylglycerophosphate/cardiolipin synthase-like enzyme
MGRMRRLGILCLALGTLASPLSAATQAFFTSKESVEDEMVRLIEQSRTSVDMALYELRLPPLIHALDQAKSRGVRIQLLLDISQRGKDLSTGEVRWLGGKNNGGRGIMHHKFVLFDRQKVVTGSFNWTPGAEHVNYENALLIDDPETVKSFSEEFDTLWQRGLAGAPPPGAAESGDRREWHGRKHHSPWLSSKCIKIKLLRPVRKRGRKTHTSRPCPVSK